ncbi:MAG: hypothetical protein QF832_01750 [SAR324 cluster bacterium]|nr:hypothetical protein [SAR324 cluster bacterium]MDP7498175.1 hypothetical protein [SAR324 cluster bacterium]
MLTCDHKKLVSAPFFGRTDDALDERNAEQGNQWFDFPLRLKPRSLTCGNDKAFHLFSTVTMQYYMQ